MARGDGRYDKMYETFILNKYPHVVDKWDDYGEAKTLRNLLDKMNVYGKFKDLLENTANFLDRSMRNSVVISNCLYLLKLISGYHDAHAMPILREIFLVVCAFCFPLIEQAPYGDFMFDKIRLISTS